MEFHLSFSTTLAATFFVIAIIAFMLNRKKEIAPPHAKGAWPLIGHLHLLGGSNLPHKVLGDMAEEYGPIFTIKLGVHKALVVSDGEIARECFTTNDKVFANRPKSMAAELMGYNYAIFGFAPFGDYWRQMRKFVIREVLSQRRVEMIGHVRVSEVRTSMKYMYEAWVSKKESEGSDMVKMEMKQWFGTLVLNIVVKVVSGKRFCLNDEAGVRFQNAVRKFFELLGAFVVSDFIPYMKVFDIGGYEKQMKIVVKEIDDIFEGWLEDYKREKESGQQHEGFIDLLISFLQNASQQDFHGFNHDTIVKASCLTIFIAALDTTSVTLTWALSLLLNNPESLKIAQDEIDEHVGRKRAVEESDMKNLVYLEAIIKETLRLYPLPLSVPHEAMEDCVVSGYNIPKSTRLLVNLWKMHRDPNIWPNPCEFKPERFMTSQKDIDVKGNHFELLPFGSGRRMCPGVSFAQQVLRLTLASLIQQFVLNKASDEPIDMTESFGLTTGKATPLEILLTPSFILSYTFC